MSKDTKTPDDTIKFVKKWLANPESVTKEEREENRRAALAATADAYDAAAIAAHSAAYYAAHSAAYYAAHSAAYYAADAAHWVKRYKELTK